MKEIGAGLWQVEEGDSDSMDKLQKHVEEMVRHERARLNEARGHEWWADATFFLHDMITFTGIIRNHYDAKDLADAIIDTVTQTVLEMLKRVVGEDKVSETYSNLLFDAKALDDIARARVNGDPELAKIGLADSLQGLEAGSNEGPRH
jgi:hypothetical protein